MFSRGFAALTVLLLLAMPGSVQASNDAPIATILCYHVVESPSDTHFAISREEFLRQVHYLKDTGYNVISLQDLVRYYEGELDSLPENAVVITVDDGWKCTYDIIYKELSRLDIPFTAFLYPKYILGGNYSLNWDQVREMADNGVDIQSHTLSHGYLTRQASKQGSGYETWLRNELLESKRILEEKTGKPVSVLAYPYGAYDGFVAGATANAGYSAALSCNFGSVSSETDPFRLNRVVIDRSTTFAQFRKYLGADRLEITDVSPAPGQKWSNAYPVVGARIVNPEAVDPASVQIKMLNGGDVPFFYDPRDGSVSFVLREDVPEREQEVLVWARDLASGERVEASWTFRPGDFTPPPPRPVIAERQTAPPQADPTSRRDPVLTGGSFE